MTRTRSGKVASPPANTRRTRSNGTANISQSLSQVEHNARELKKTLRASKDEGQAGDESDDDRGAPSKPRRTQKKTVTRKSKVNNVIALLRILIILLADERSGRGCV